MLKTEICRAPNSTIYQIGRSYTITIFQKMKDFFGLPKLLIKNKIKVLKEGEKKDLHQLREKYPFARKLDYGNISEKIDYYSSIDTEKAWETLRKKRAAAKNRPVVALKTKKWLKYAAIFIGIVGIGSYLYLFLPFTTDSISPDSESITLQQENGNIEVIADNEDQKITTTHGDTIGILKKGRLYYKKDTDLDKLVYNELSIPYGKQFELILSDGTHIHLNSGTSIKYPVKFIEGKNREVFVKGEAYLDVAKDSVHPFIVNAGPVNVEVLGTKFNISSYPGDNDLNTVLVEGSVEISPDIGSNRSLVLKPNQKATWNKSKKNIVVNTVDTDIYTGWIDGKLIFKDVPFTDISKKLERHYNVTIINENLALKSERFDATFDIETIEQVLRSFKENHPTLNYTINNKKNTITIH